MNIYLSFFSPGHVSAFCAEPGPDPRESCDELLAGFGECALEAHSGRTSMACGGGCSVKLFGILLSL